MHPTPRRHPAPLVFLLASTLGLAACPQEAPPPPAAPAQPAAPPAPTAEDARAFIDRTETELKKLWTHHERTKFVQLTFVNDDTEALSAEAEAQTMAYLA